MITTTVLPLIPQPAEWCKGGANAVRSRHNLTEISAKPQDNSRWKRLMKSRPLLIQKIIWAMLWSVLANKISWARKSILLQSYRRRVHKTLTSICTTSNDRKSKLKLSRSRTRPKNRQKWAGRCHHMAISKLPAAPLVEIANSLTTWCRIEILKPMTTPNKSLLDFSTHKFSMTILTALKILRSIWISQTLPIRHRSWELRCSATGNLKIPGWADM